MSSSNSLLSLNDLSKLREAKLAFNPGSLLLPSVPAATA